MTREIKKDSSIPTPPPKKIFLLRLTQALAMMKNTQTKKTPSAPREQALKPEPRPAEEPGGTVESPRGKGVAVTQQFILTLPLPSSKQWEVICSPSAAMPSDVGIFLPDCGSDVAISG